MDKASFLSEFKRLEADFVATAPNVYCLQSENLKGCSNCNFSRGLTNCYRSTHCTDCQDCSNLSHSHGCKACHASSHLIRSRHCTGSAYLIECNSCADCTYCFGCVGLAKKDFHILNVEYGRGEYFKIVEKLRRELSIH